MSIFSRFANVVRSNVNSWIDGAEDPEKMLNQMIIDLEKQKGSAKEQVAIAIANKNQLKRSLEKEQNEAKQWEQKAILAVQNDRDELAKEALMRKKEHEKRSIEFEQQLNMHQTNTDALHKSFQELEDKIEEIKRKKGLLVAKQKTAEAQQKIYSTIEGMDGQGAIATIERMETKIEDMQSKSEAYQELTIGKDSLDKQFKALGNSAPDLDLELLELKKRAAIEHKPQ